MVGLCLLLASPALAQGRVQVDDAWDFPEARQFDFWIGEWTVNNRFLQDDGNWVDGGEAHVKIFPILDGKAILEFWDGEARGGNVLRGYSLRYFDKETGQWQLSLNWPSPNQPRFSELTGIFRHGRGEFFNQGTTAEGQDFIVRYTFSDITPATLRWDDGVSTDGGRTWRENWIMEFTRAEETAAWPATGEPFHTRGTGQRCTNPEVSRFDMLDGRWEGTVGYERDGRRMLSPARLEGYRVLDGCAVFNVVEYFIGGVPHKQFEIRSYFPEQQQWIELHLNDQPGTGYRYRAGTYDPEEEVLALTGFVPEWAKGPPPNVLTRTTWTALSGDKVAYSIAESMDGGRRWTTIYDVELRKRDGAGSP